jgi:hypothetical protein
MGRKQASAAAAGALRAPALLYLCLGQSRTVAVKDEPKNKKASRERRLGAALRENLKRRKAQARARAVAAPSHDSAGIARDDKEKEG